MYMYSLPSRLGHVRGAMDMSMDMGQCGLPTSTISDGPSF